MDNALDLDGLDHCYVKNLVHYHPSKFIRSEETPTHGITNTCENCGAEWDT